jgi:hypothetical protein
MKLAPKARVCAICGRTGGTVASTLHLRWFRERRPDLVPFEGDYMHPACFRAADAIAAAKNPSSHFKPV